MLEQQPNHRQVALEGRAGQRGVALVVAQLRVAAMLEQHPRGVQVTVIAGQHQQAVAVAVADVGRQAPREQIAEALRIAVAGAVEDLLGEGQGSIVQFGLVGSVHLGSSAPRLPLAGIPAVVIVPSVSPVGARSLSMWRIARLNCRLSRAGAQSVRRKATRSAFSSWLRPRCSTRLKNSTVSSSVSRRPSCR